MTPRILLLTAMACFCAAPAGYGLSLSDVPVSPACSTAFEPVYRLLDRLPRHTDFVYTDRDEFFDNAAPLDSARSLLEAAANTVGRTAAPPYTAALMQGTLLHMLDRLRTPGAGLRADSSFNAVTAAYPDSIGGPWFKALRTLHTGHLLQGIGQLDSIAATNPGSEAFWRSYARNTYASILPAAGSAPPADLFIRTSPDSGISDSARREQPRLSSWNIVMDDTSHDVPSYIYRLSFSYPKKWRRELVAREGTATSATAGGSMMPQYISSFFLNKLFFQDRRSASDIYVIIDLNNTTALLQEFIASRIPRAFDSVAVDTSFRDRRAFSIEYFQVGAAPDTYGSYVRMVGLKRFITEDEIVMTPDPGRKARQISYLITLVTCREDRQRAAAAFDGVCGSFLR